MTSPSVLRRPERHTAPDSSVAWWWRFAPAAAALAILAGVALRLWAHSALWLDEAQTVAFAKQPMSHLPALLRTDGAPPLYYVVLHGWIKAFGDGIWAVRSLSMLASVLALPAAWLVARRLGADREVAWITVVLFAVNPWSIRYAGEARMYSLVALEVLLGMLALSRVHRRGDRLGMLGLALCSADLLYTHYWAQFLLVTVGAGLMVVAWRRPGERRFVGRALLGLVLGALTFLPWVPIMLYQAQHTGAPWAQAPNLGSLAALPQDWSGGYATAGTLGMLLLVVMLAVAIFIRRAPDGAVTLTRPGGTSAWLATVTAVTLLLALGAAMADNGAVVGRYTAVVVPLVLLLLALGVARLPQPAAAAVLAGFTVLGLSTGVTAATSPHTRADKVANVLNASAREGDLIVYCPDQLAPAVEARLHVTGVSRLELPSETDPSVVNWVDYKERVAAIQPRPTAARIEAFLKGDPGASIWWVGTWDYRTHTRICGPLYDRLLAGLGLPTVLVPDTGAFEHPGLQRFTH